MLKEADAKSIANLRQLLRECSSSGLVQLALSRITLDFDGSVQSTMRHAEGTAVGFNKKKKGARSYYPLFCTIAQTGQVLDFLHRSGNVHDSHGAQEFILACVQAVREALPGVVIEVRMDSAFFSDEIVMAMEEANIEFTVSVPFERFVELKKKIEARKQWTRLTARCPISRSRGSRTLGSGGSASCSSARTPSVSKRDRSSWTSSCRTNTATTSRSW